MILKVKVIPCLLGREDEFGEAWVTETGDPRVRFVFADELITADTGRTGMPTDWDPASLKESFQRAVRHLMPEAQIAWIELT